MEIAQRACRLRPFAQHLSSARPFAAMTAQPGGTAFTDADQTVIPVVSAGTMCWVRASLRRLVNNRSSPNPRLALVRPHMSNAPAVPTIWREVPPLKFRYTLTPLGDRNPASRKVMRGHGRSGESLQFYKCSTVSIINTAEVERPTFLLL